MVNFGFLLLFFMSFFYPDMLKAFQDILTLGKVLLRSRRPSPGARPASRPGTITVMGNGPSLRSVIADKRDALMANPRLAVNFAANAPEFPELAPQYYILADPHFFNGVDTDTNVARLWHNLQAVSWQMTLYLPLQHKAAALPRLRELPANLTVKWYNLTPAEGGGALTRFLISRGLAMPRPRNVLIPAIMAAIREGFSEIELVGADHSWLQSLWVDGKNRVVSVQPHFYKDNEKELDRVAREYEGYHLHDILLSMTVALRSYFDIRRFADKKGISIFNATEGSFIDAFPRRGFGQTMPKSTPTAPRQ